VKVARLIIASPDYSIPNVSGQWPGAVAGCQWSVASGCEVTCNKQPTTDKDHLATGHRPLIAFLNMESQVVQLRNRVGR